MTRIVVSGGRDFADQRKLFDVLSALHVLLPGGIEFVGEGGARGADRMARTWAQLHGVPTECIKAEWTKYGKLAGHLRNSELLTQFKPDLVVAFPTGGPGTANMIKQAKERGIKLEIIK